MTDRNIGCRNNTVFRTVPDNMYPLPAWNILQPGVLANIASVLGNNDVSIAQVVQKRRNSGVAELVIITDEVEEKNFNDAMAIFEGMSVISEIAGVIRVH